MKSTIDRLIINSPYEEPGHYWSYDRESRLFDLKEGRRPAGLPDTFIQRVIYDPERIGVEGIVQGLARSGYCAGRKDPLERPPALPTLTSRKPSLFQPDELVCFCFGYSRQDIEADFIQHHRSLIQEKIAAEKKAGGCDCAHKNPKGR